MSGKKKGTGGAATDAWENARKQCGLSRRQIEMAQKLGMNPKKLPGLRPSPSQKWKLPVGEFIEECYLKRFGDGEAEQPRITRAARPPGRAAATAAPATDGMNRAFGQIEDLHVYLANLSDHLGRWLEQGMVPAALPHRVGEQLQDVAALLLRGASIPQTPDLELSPLSDRSDREADPATRDGFAGEEDPDDIPF